jgi:hypothetical protein
MSAKFGRLQDSEISFALDVPFLLADANARAQCLGVISRNRSTTTVNRQSVGLLRGDLGVQSPERLHHQDTGNRGNSDSPQCPDKIAIGKKLDHTNESI